MSEARVVSVILTSSCVGKGTEEDPYRTRQEAYTMDGLLVFWSDSKDEYINYEILRTL